MIADLLTAAGVLFLAAFGIGVLLVSMGNRLPTGPGSRGGRWHLPGYANAYKRAWRAAHPEYRARERLRRARAKSRTPADIVDAPSFPRPLPEPAVTCVCECGCQEPVVTVCGFCRDGQHREEAG